MAIYLHIGTTKTGTTSIQSFLAANRAAVQDRGLLYPVVSGRGEIKHSKLTTYCADFNPNNLQRYHYRMGITTEESIEAFRQMFRKRFVDTLKDWPRDILLSQETLYRRVQRPSEFERLTDLLAPVSDDLRMIVYIRRQDEFCLSLYSESVKTGNVRPFRWPDADQSKIYYYGPMIDRWAELLGKDKVTVRLYGKPYFADVIDDFCSIVGLDTAGLERPPRVNSSLTPTALEWLRRMNVGVGPQILDGKRNPHRQSLVSTLESIDVADDLVLATNEDRKRFAERFDDDNTAVARKWFNRDNLFDTTDLDRPTTKSADLDLSLDRAFAIFADLWKTARPD